MMLFEMHSQMTRDWFAAVEQGSRMVSEACMAASKDTAKAFEAALSGLAPRPQSAMSAMWTWPWGETARAWSPTALNASSAFNAPSLPTWPAMPQVGWTPTVTIPNWGMTVPMLPFWPSPVPVMGVWPFGLASAAPSPVASTVALQEAFATACQTASGYAMARILDAPAPAARKAAPQLPWPFDWGIWGLGR